ncbi:MAG: (d)CMP kinase [Prevotellaceae bacterium]|jgi:cytidylate kinase|nr:(d)CMP kinase [Prevotellaceae bacterium]
MRKIIVAIDGFSSSGKSTIAKTLAKEAGYIYIDTGAMYRAVALFCAEHNWIDNDAIDEKSLRENIDKIAIRFKTNEEGKTETYLNGKNVEKEIRSLEIANGASRVSTLGFVRKNLVARQQKMGTSKGVVMDGRDIGTVVFPNAELKLFITATPEVRARRRMTELQNKGENVKYEDVLANVKERDYRDTHRAESPLVRADDAVEIDNSEMTPEKQLETVRALFHEKVF